MKQLLFFSIFLISTVQATSTDIPAALAQPEAASLYYGMTYSSLNNILLSPQLKEAITFEEIAVPKLIVDCNIAAQKVINAAVADPAVSVEALVEIVTKTKTQQASNIQKIASSLEDHPLNCTKIACAIKRAACTDEERLALWGLFLSLRIKRFGATLTEDKKKWADPCKVFGKLSKPWKRAVRLALPANKVVFYLLMTGGAVIDYVDINLFHEGKVAAFFMSLVLTAYITLMVRLANPATSLSQFHTFLQDFAKILTTTYEKTKDHLPQALRDELEGLQEQLSPSAYQESENYNREALIAAFEELCAFYRGLQEMASLPSSTT